MIKVIATDLDGTLLDERGDFDRLRFAKIYQRLEERGIRFLVATGNGLGRIGLIFGDLAAQLPLVAENGARLVENGETLAYYCLEAAAIGDFLTYFEGNLAAYSVVLTTEEGAYTLATSQFVFEGIDPVQLQAYLDSLVRLEDFGQLDLTKVKKVSMLLPEADCEAIMADFNQAFAGRLRAVTSGFGAVDILPVGVDKGRGLSFFLDRWGLSPDQVMAFGDGGNDQELLALAGHSYAMANAPESVKAVAKFEAPSNRDQGVLTVLETYLDQLDKTDNVS